MWPLLLDLNKDECRRMMRKLELDAYSSIVSAFRAQGDLTKDKKKSLVDLCTFLSIPPERHKAEVRRAVNDEKLATIADQISGSSLASEWALEGRRLVPLMPRLVPQTAFTTIADNTAVNVGAQNALLPLPSDTSKMNLKTQDHSNDEIMKLSLNSPTMDSSAVTDSVTKSAAGGFNSDLQNIPPVKIAAGYDSSVFDKSGKRKRSSSVEVQNIHKDINQLNTPVTKVSSLSSSGTRTVSIPIGGTPVQFTLTGSNQKSSNSLQSTSSTPQKVILVSTSCSNLTSSLLQRSVGVPIVKTVATTSATVSIPQLQPYSKTTAVIVSTQNEGIMTTANTVSALSCSTVSGIGPKSAVNTATSQTSTKITGRRVKQGIILPVVAQSPSSITSSTSKTIQLMSGGKPSFHIKEGSGLKIIAQTVPVTAGGKGLSKSSVSSSGSPIVVVTKTASPGGSQSTRVVNVLSTQAGSKVITPTTLTLSKASGSGPTFVTVGQKGKQTALVKVSPNMSLSPSGGKPNVIVVQKAHMLQHSQDGNTNVVAFSKNPSLQSSHKGILPSASNRSKPVGITKTISSWTPSVTKESVVQLSESTLTSSSNKNDNILSGEKCEIKSTMLADLLQAAGILPGGSEETFEADDQTDTILETTSSVENVSTKSSHAVGSEDVAVSSSISLKDESRHQEELTIAVKDTISSVKNVQPVTLSSSSKETEENAIYSTTSLSYETNEFELPESDNRELDPKTGEFHENVISDAQIINTVGGNVSTLAQADASTSTANVEQVESTESSSKLSDVKPLGVFVKEMEDADNVISNMVEPETSDEQSVDQDVEENVIIQENLVCEEVPFEDQMEDMMVTIEDMASEVVETSKSNQNVVVEQLSEDQSIDIQSLPTDASIEVSSLDAGEINDSKAPSTSGSSFFMVTDSVIESESSNLQVVDLPVLEDRGSGDEGASKNDGATCSSQSLKSSEMAPDSTPQKRKRKPVTQVYSGGSMPHLSGWNRSAMGLLLKVMKYRGTRRMKGEAGASHWFLQPVTDDEAPGYSQIVKFPMDFSTIKKRLEAQSYEDISEFHKDMILVKHNCELYNPPDHEARVDCDEVFGYYQQEYDRLTEKWVKTHLMSPQRKKIKPQT